MVERPRLHAPIEHDFPQCSLAHPIRRRRSGPVLRNSRMQANIFWGVCESAQVNMITRSLKRAHAVIH